MFSFDNPTRFDWELMARSDIQMIRFAKFEILFDFGQTEILFDFGQNEKSLPTSLIDSKLEWAHFVYCSGDYCVQVHVNVEFYCRIEIRKAFGICFLDWNFQPFQYLWFDFDVYGSQLSLKSFPFRWTLIWWFSFFRRNCRSQWSTLTHTHTPSWMPRFAIYTTAMNHSFFSLSGNESES